MLSDTLLSRINSPDDLKQLTIDELNRLCGEIRKELIETVSVNGGHLASNLGVVELTVALHSVFNLPEDQIVWDVGHQCYTHKMLTGRREQLSTIRTEGGLSGFPKRTESEYDPFNSGHSSTSISAAFGLAMAKGLQNDPGHVIAVIGDGALSGGLAYEGLNNAGRYKKNLIVILNDNKMSISRNVGSMARYLATIRAKPGYLRVKGNVENVLMHTPLIGMPLRDALLKSKSVIRNLVYNSTLFEDMGFVYYGPFDGHDLEKLTSVLKVAKQMSRPVFIHVVTTKGKGYPFAERDPGAFHGISGFDIETGEQNCSGECFSDVFGQKLSWLASEDNRVCAITAAMKTGTGLAEFSHQFKDRFFDVGIAESHAVTFAAGLAANGMLPVFAVYSTFLQRSYDQIIHDAAMQNLKVTLAIDRAGIVGEDGETHQGLFDIAFLNSIPNVTVFSPSYYSELMDAMNKALYECEGVCAIRYPRGSEWYKPADFKCSGKAYDLYGNKDAPFLLITFGRLFSYACAAQKQLLKQGIDVCILKLNRIKPIDASAVADAMQYKKLFFFEEGMQSGGVGEHFGYQLQKRGFDGSYAITAVDDAYVQQADVKSALKRLNLDDEGMAHIIATECAK